MTSLTTSGYFFTIVIKIGDTQQQLCICHHEHHSWLLSGEITLIINFKKGRDGNHQLLTARVKSALAITILNGNMSIV